MKPLTTALYVLRTRSPSNSSEKKKKQKNFLNIETSLRQRITMEFKYNVKEGTLSVTPEYHHFDSGSEKLLTLKI